jgi:hypothetical protein
MHGGAVPVNPVSATVGVPEPAVMVSPGAGATIARPGSSPGIVMSLMPTRAPSFDFGRYASLVIRIRTKSVRPGTVSSACGVPTGRTIWRRRPAEVSIETSLTGGPSRPLTTNEA